MSSRETQKGRNKENCLKEHPTARFNELCSYRIESETPDSLIICVSEQRLLRDCAVYGGLKGDGNIASKKFTFLLNHAFCHEPGQNQI